ncbi:hypothetical protein NCC49_003029 [Naganishia albida]|nr:hypothetical protein NCC49_003029 [Naganishia albida]
MSEAERPLLALWRKLKQCRTDLNEAEMACNEFESRKRKRNRIADEVFPHKEQFRKYVDDIRELLKTKIDIGQLPQTKTERKKLQQWNKTLQSRARDLDEEKFVRVSIEAYSATGKVEGLKVAIKALAKSANGLAPHWEIWTDIAPTHDISQGPALSQTTSTSLLDDDALADVEDDDSIANAVLMARSLIIESSAFADVDQADSRVSFLRAQIIPSLSCKDGDIDVAFSVHLTACSGDSAPHLEMTMNDVEQKGADAGRVVLAEEVASFFGSEHVNSLPPTLLLKFGDRCDGAYHELNDAGERLAEGSDESMAVDMAENIFSTLTDAFEASTAGAVVRAIREKAEREFTE